MKTYEYWLKYYENATKEQVIEDSMHDIEEITNLQQENKQLKEKLENDIDRYEDTISYQLGFDKGKEYLQQRIDKALNYIHIFSSEDNNFCLDYHELNELKKILKGDKE